MVAQEGGMIAAPGTDRTQATSVTWPGGRGRVVCRSERTGRRGGTPDGIQHKGEEPLGFVGSVGGAACHEVVVKAFGQGQNHQLNRPQRLCAWLGCVLPRAQVTAALSRGARACAHTQLARPRLTWNCGPTRTSSRVSLENASANDETAAW